MTTLVLFIYAWIIHFITHGRKVIRYSQTLLRLGERNLTCFLGEAEVEECCTVDEEGERSCGMNKHLLSLSMVSIHSSSSTMADRQWAPREVLLFFTDAYDIVMDNRCDQCDCSHTRFPHILMATSLHNSTSNSMAYSSK